MNLDVTALTNPADINNEVLARISACAACVCMSTKNSKLHSSKTQLSPQKRKLVHAIDNAFILCTKCDKQSSAAEKSKIF